MANEETAPDRKLEHLRNQKELIELKEQIAELRAPWWRKASLIATVTAILAAVLPITTAIQEHYRSERELTLQQARQESELALQRVRQQTDIALEQTKQENDIRIAYLDRFEHPGHRMQTLRFLLATSTDAKLLAWAREEQKQVQAQLDVIEQELLAVKQRIDKTPPGQLLDELKKERDRLSDLKNLKGRAPPPSKTGPE